MTALTILLGIIGLGLMMFIHELGHFVAAKINGVAVETFSLGWGPRLVGFHWRGTTYQISWLPIGGYCKMKGELVPGIAGGSGTEQAAIPERGSFLAASPWRRIVIAVFGPLFNVVFAILAFTVIWWAGFAIPSSDNRVILASDYTLDSFATPPPATVAGLRTGDRITAINGVPVEKFQDIVETVSVAPGKRFLFTVQRDVQGASQVLTLPIAPELDRSSGAGRIGIYAWVDPVVDTVAPNSSAAVAGLRKGDRLISVDGKPVLNTIDLEQALQGKPAKLAVELDRGGERLNDTLVVNYDEKGSTNLGIGFASKIYHSLRVGPGGAFVHSLEETGNTIGLTLKGFGLLFRGIQLRNAVAGPLRITYYIGSAAASGLQMGLGAGVVAFFRLLSFLSVVLFLMNLLPIPAMDGGQVVLFLVEVARGKPVRSQLIWRLQLLGFSLLILLSLMVTFSDILFFAGR